MPRANLTTLNNQVLSALQGMLKKFHVRVWRISAAGTFDPKVWNLAVIAVYASEPDVRFRAVVPLDQRAGTGCKGDRPLFAKVAYCRDDQSGGTAVGVPSTPAEVRRLDLATHSIRANQLPSRIEG